MSARKRHSLPHPDKEWTTAFRPRVLLEADDPARAWADEKILREAGYDVAVCWGIADFEEQRCPLATGGACALAEQADAIFATFSPTSEKAYAVLRVLGERFPTKPCAAEFPEPAAARLHAEAPACRLVGKPVTRQALEQAVARMVGG